MPASLEGDCGKETFNYWGPAGPCSATVNSKNQMNRGPAGVCLALSPCATYGYFCHAGRAGRSRGSVGRLLSLCSREDRQKWRKVVWG